MNCVKNVKILYFYIIMFLANSTLASPNCLEGEVQSLIGMFDGSFSRNRAEDVRSSDLKLRLAIESVDRAMIITKSALHVIDRQKYNTELEKLVVMRKQAISNVQRLKQSLINLDQLVRSNRIIDHEKYEIARRNIDTEIATIMFSLDRPIEKEMP
jgi:hypothetical protein